MKDVASSQFPAAENKLNRDQANELCMDTSVDTSMDVATNMDASSSCMDMDTDVAPSINPFTQQSHNTGQSVNNRLDCLYYQAFNGNLFLSTCRPSLV